MRSREDQTGVRARLDIEVTYEFEESLDFCCWSFTQIVRVSGRGHPILTVITVRIKHFLVNI